MRRPSVGHVVDIIARSEDLKPFGRIWGSGGWLMPEYREALDWATLVRLLGWSVGVSLDCNGGSSALVVLAADPDWACAELVEDLGARIERGAVLVARAASNGQPLAKLAGAFASAGASKCDAFFWRGPGRAESWRSGERVYYRKLVAAADAEVWAEAEGEPLILARRMGRGVLVTLAFHPSEARDADGTLTALLRTLLVRARGVPVAWLDFEATLVLRMDDPGGAQNVHSESWLYPKMGLQCWREIRRELESRNARLSVGYVAGWVDDGEPSRGELFVDGSFAERIPGAVHPSPLVVYQSYDGMRHDYREEYAGIDELRAAGCGEVELHGFTHMQPNRDAWLAAPDRYSSNRWYRELGVVVPHEKPLERGLEAFDRWFHTRPAVLICPGDEWVNETLEHALDLGFELVSSYYLGIEDSGRLLWATHVCAPYLNQAEPSWFASGLPVVGYFHDRELALDGVSWMTENLDRWSAAGARRFLDLRELAGLLSLRIRAEDHSISIEQTRPDAFFRGCPLRVYAPGESSLSVKFAGTNKTISIDAHGHGVVVLPGAEGRVQFSTPQVGQQFS